MKNQYTNYRFFTLYGIQAIVFLAMVINHAGLGTLSTWALTVFFSLSGFLLMNENLDDASRVEKLGRKRFPWAF